MALVDDHSPASLPAVEGELVAVVCTTGDDGARRVALGREQQVPCVLGVSFDGASPAEGVMVMVDCSDVEGVVAVVDGGTSTS